MKITNFIVLLFFPLLLAAQSSNIQSGWDYFVKNEFDEAKSSFKKGLNEATEAEACLGLSIVGIATGDVEMASNYIQQFYKASSNPKLYLEALWTLYDADEADNPKKFLSEVVASEDGKIKAMASQTLGHYLRGKNKFKESAAAFAKTGAIRDWQVLGEFENISESGYDKDFGALAHPESSYEFKNKYNAIVKWFPVKGVKFSNWVDMQYYFQGDEAITYAQTFCNSPMEQVVQFRVGTSGSVKVWVNDKIMFTESEERNNGIDTYIFTVKLMKGFNRILVQLGASEIDDLNFLVRLTDTKGNSVEGLTYSNKTQPYPKDYQFEPEIIPRSAEQFFLKQIRENPDAPINYILLNQMYISNQMTYQAKKNLKIAREKFPDCSYFTLQQLYAHSQDNNETEVSKCLEEIKLKNPDFRIVIDVLFSEAMEREDYKEAEKLLEKINKMEPNSKDVYSKRIELANAKQELETLIATINEAYRKYPKEYEFVVLRVLVETQVKNNINGGMKILKAYLKKVYNENAIDDLISLYSDVGRIEMIIDLQKKIIKEMPIAVGRYYKLYELYYSSGLYRKAIENIDECLKIAPYIAKYHSSKGEAYAELKENLKAKENLEKGIYYYPQNYDARERLRNLQGSADIFESFDKIDVYDIFKNSPEADEYPEDNSIILVNAVHKVVYPGGGSQEKHILVAKAFNNSGVNTWKEYSIPVYRNQRAIVEKIEVLKKNGSRLEANRSGSYVAFPNLEPGDAIHITWNVRNYYSGMLLSHFWDHHYFSFFVPAKSSEYSLMIAPEAKFNYHVENGDSMEPTIIEKEGSKIYQWKATDVPAIKDEKYMPALSSVGKTLFVSSFEDWNTISNWYADLAHAKAKVDFEVTEVVNELFEGKENLTDEEKIKEIYSYIQKNIRYSSVSFIQSALIPQKASKVISKKQGDCKDVSTLFAAMCKAQGIDANLVLVNTRNNYITKLPVPSINFNHCIAKVNLDNEDYFIELTSENLPFSSGLESVKGVFVLEIPVEKDAKSEAVTIDPPTRLKNVYLRESFVTFDDDLMVVDKESKAVGVFAAYIRNLYKDLGEEKQTKKMQEAIAKSYAKLKLTDLNFDSTLQNNADTLIFNYKFEVPSVFTELGSLLIFDLPWSDKFDSPSFLSTEERNTPVELWKFFDGEYYKEVVNIEIPKGKKLSDVPKNILLDTENASYSLVYEKIGDNLFVTRTLTIKDDQVKPENYQDFKKFIGDVIKADKRQVAFKE